jgi:hypothetical protein
MEIETVSTDMSQAVVEEQAAAQAQADREREQAVDTTSNAQTITDPNLGQTVNILD